MGRFNLLEEPWIRVVVDPKGETEEVSLLELFDRAPQFLRLGGEMGTQDFAVLRVLLAVLHTVFSRVDAEGRPYSYLRLDEKFQPSKVEEVDQDEVRESLGQTWFNLWEQGHFPVAVREYLEAWKDHFYLFDDAYPFYQVTEEVIAPENISKSKPSEMKGKNINRLISESNNKVALFSPKYSNDSNKELLTEAELARWLITLQGYVGLSDKVIFGTTKYKASKGWIFDVGGLYWQGGNIFETLLLNLVLTGTDNDVALLDMYHNLQRPCWEYSGQEVVHRILSSHPVDNLSELYTNWSRAIHINPDADLTSPFSLQMVKLKEISHSNPLEPMTLWKYGVDEKKNEVMTPRKHRSEESLWRSFGLLQTSNHPDNHKLDSREPGVIQWRKLVSKSQKNMNLSLISVSMKDDANATSWVPKDEILDQLQFQDLLITDDKDQGWYYRVLDQVEKTKTVISKTYWHFLTEIATIRNIKDSDYVKNRVQDLYFAVDLPFRNWISSIRATDSCDARCLGWNETLRGIVLEEANQVIQSAGPRDYTGVFIKDPKEAGSGQFKNIATAYLSFQYFLKQSLGAKKGGNDETGGR